ncbi:MAG: response regulator [Melioribacteraceae bacterium]|nr:response regulator [Melioribacteraceae bacterium]
MANILVVEDEISVNENICEILSIENHNCISAHNGLEALEVLKSNQIDLILSDIMMPQMDGISLYKNIVDEGKFWNIPFVFLTAKSEEADFREAMRLGASDYLRKPFKMKDLIDAVNVRLKKSKQILNRIDVIKSNISKYIPHELRTPIGVILGYSNLILEDYKELETDEIISMVGLVEESCLRLKDRIEKLILLTEIELDIDSKHEINSVISVDENLIVELCANPIGYYNRNKDLKVTAEPVKINIPKYYLEVLIHELIDNACKFSNPGNEIKVTGKKNTDLYYLVIEDKGIGIEMDEIAKLSAFIQIGRESKQQEGNGLGLTAVNRILDLINGSVSINSSKGTGTAIEVKLPIEKEISE